MNDIYFDENLYFCRVLKLSIVMNKIRSGFRFARLFLFFRRKVKEQSEFYRQNLSAQMENLLVNTDREIAGRLMQRTKKYSIAVPARLGEAYCILRGKPMTHNERMALTCLGGLTGLFDDLIDENKLTDEQILRFVETKKNEAGLADLDLIKFLYEKAFECSENEELIAEQTYKVVISQIESRKQNTKKLTVEELKQISADKGGAAMLMYRGAFGGEVSKAEKEMLCQLGAAGQYVNDIFDVYDDTQAGIATFANQTTCAEELLRDFSEDMDKTLKVVRNAGFLQENVNQFLRIVVLILSGALVCIRNYRALQKKYGGNFQPQNYSRKELICDMENPATVMKLLPEATKLNKNIT